MNGLIKFIRKNEQDTESNECKYCGEFLPWNICLDCSVYLLLGCYPYKHCLVLLGVCVYIEFNFWPHKTLLKIKDEIIRQERNRRDYSK